MLKVNSESTQSGGEKLRTRYSTFTFLRQLYQSCVLGPTNSIHPLQHPSLAPIQLKTLKRENCQLCCFKLKPPKNFFPFKHAVKNFTIIIERRKVSKCVYMLKLL